MSLIAMLVLVGCASAAGLRSSTTRGVSSTPTASVEGVPRWSPPIAIPSQTAPNALAGAVACSDRAFCVAITSLRGRAVLRRTRLDFAAVDRPRPASGRDLVSVSHLLCGGRWERQCGHIRRIDLVDTGFGVSRR